jgi:D-serine deaminase-like pyridoxal phosphate-dependent protein
VSAGLEAVDTPALLVDRALAEQNIARLMPAFRGSA